MDFLRPRQVRLRVHPQRLLGRGQGGAQNRAPPGAREGDDVGQVELPPAVPGADARQGFAQKGGLERIGARVDLRDFPLRLRRLVVSADANCIPSCLAAER